MRCDLQKVNYYLHFALHIGRRVKFKADAHLKVHPLFLVVYVFESSAFFAGFFCKGTNQMAFKGGFK